MRILLIDDHVVVRKGIIEIMSVNFSDIEFKEAGNAEEARFLVGEYDFDLVVLDIALPGEDGLTVLEQILKINPDLKVLVLSMYAEQNYATRAFEGGAKGYITKGAVPEELVGAIDKIFAGGTYASASLDKPESTDGDGEKSSLQQLSERELEVLRMLAKGERLTNIANMLDLHPKTVSTYKTRLMKKLELENNAQLIRFGLEMGLAD